MEESPIHLKYYNQTQMTEKPKILSSVGDIYPLSYSNETRGLMDVTAACPQHEMQET